MSIPDSAPLSKPMIGITSGRRQNMHGQDVIGAPESYIQALLQAGAAPVLVPLGLPEDRLARLLSGLDGLLFSGGGDVHPDRYASQWHPLVDGVDPDRDRTEIWLAEHTLQSGKPFLGICRGLQVINVALGGSLYEDILAQRPGSLHHQNSPQHPRDYLAHSVQISAGSQLLTILQEEVSSVNSLHHQGIRRLAAGLQPSAYAPDGVIEAFEIPGYLFGLAVQWHPECLTTQTGMQRLFHAFTRACGGQQESSG